VHPNFYTTFTLFLYLMESKCCSVCAQKRVLSCFLKNPSANPGTKVFSTCIPCRDKAKKRRALQPLDANRPSKRPDVSRPLFEAPTNPSILLVSSTSAANSASNPAPAASPVPLSIPPAQPRPIQSVQRPVQPQPILPAQPQAAGFLPAEQWGYIQRFNAAMEEVKMETCLRCKEGRIKGDPEPMSRTTTPPLPFSSSGHRAY
jgi:hypothetical protein